MTRVLFGPTLRAVSMRARRAHRRQIPIPSLADPQTETVDLDYPLLCTFGVPFRFGQAEEAVANLPLRLAVRVHCGHQV